MPRIPPDIIDSILYLYPTRQAAKDGERVGGSGLLVVVPSVDVTQLTGHLDGYLPGDIYAVTNQHVVFGDSDSTVIGLNTQAGAREILETDAQDWYRHPAGDDVAVCPLELDRATLKFAAIPTYFFASESYPEMNAFDLGPGDEVVFVGRFSTHDGKLTNRPSARFGNISMFPSEPVFNPRTEITQESLLVEARSLPGYSGSPVFVYNIAGGFSTPYRGPIGGERPRQSLIGLDWCHLQNPQPVLGSDYETKTGDIVWENTGLMGVVPAWKIQEVLDMDELREMREAKRK